MFCSTSSSTNISQNCFIYNSTNESDIFKNKKLIKNSTNACKIITIQKIHQKLKNLNYL